MSLVRSKKSPGKASLSVDIIAANRNSDEYVFDSDSRGNRPEKQGVKASKKSKTKYGRKGGRKDIHIFNDEDPVVKALELSYLQAHFGLGPAGKLGATAMPTPDAKKHTRQASIYSHTNSEISAGSAISTETVKPAAQQHSPVSDNMAKLEYMSVPDEVKSMMVAPKTSRLDERVQQQTSSQILPSPYGMVNTQEVNGPEHFPFANNPDAVNEVEGATHVRNFNLGSNKRTSPWATPLPVSPVALARPASPSSIYSNDAMKVTRKSVGSGSSKSTSASFNPLESDSTESPVVSFESTRSPKAPSASFSSGSENLTDEEMRRRDLRHAAYDAYKVPEYVDAIQSTGADVFIISQVEELRLKTGTVQFYPSKDTEPYLRHPNHRRKWASKNLCHFNKGYALITAANMRTYDDTFSGEKIYPGKGKLYVRGDSKIFRFQNGKTESLFLQRKNPRRIAWTTLYRRQHKKGISEEIAKKRTRRTVKQQRGIVGAPLELIKDRRSQRPEAREAARKEAIAKGKAKKSESENKKKLEKAKSASAGARGQPGRIQSKMGAKGTVNKVSAKSR
ncbi:MAG: hypothetical protein Q9163_005157 [Psora crenata]